ncbi:unnamed protein product, partial [Scytosiphon promiscuus]
MVNVHSMRCSHALCTNQPSFNTEGSKKPAYCRLHAEDGMVDAKRKPRCSHDACSRQPSFNME